MKLMQKLHNFVLKQVQYNFNVALILVRLLKVSGMRF